MLCSKTTLAALLDAALEPVTTALQTSLQANSPRRVSQQTYPPCGGKQALSMTGTFYSCLNPKAPDKSQQQ